MTKLMVLFLALGTTACASVGVTRMKDAPPKHKHCELEIFSAESEIHKPFEVICLIDSKTSANLFADRTMAGAVNELRPEACQCGADGILITGGHAEGANFWTNGQGFAVVKAIRFTGN